MSSAVNKPSEAVQSSRQKRPVEDANDNDVMMEASSCAAEAGVQAGDKVMQEDVTAKRPKTDDTSGMLSHS